MSKKNKTAKTPKASKTAKAVKPAKTASKSKPKSPKAPKKTVVAELPGRDEKSANRLFDAWVETTINNEKVDVEEIYNRIGTLFCVASQDLEITFDEAQSILFDIMERYAEDLGMPSPFLCPDCQMEQEAELLGETVPGKTDKLLN
jgi:hypothetical protein